MNIQNPNIAADVHPETSHEQLAALIEQARQGADGTGVTLIDPFVEGAQLPSGIDFARILIIGNHLAIVQDDGRVIVLVDGASGDYEIMLGDAPVPSIALVSVSAPETDWTSLAEVPLVDFAQVVEDASNQGSGVSQPLLAGNPLLGLDISPLLPFTDYPDVLERDLDEGVQDSSSPAEPVISKENGDAWEGNVLVLDETDADVDLPVSDFLSVALIGESVGETISKVILTVEGLPVGTTSNLGDLTSARNGTLTLTFEGSLADYETLALSFPEDFSTESRNDAKPGDLKSSLIAQTNLGDSVLFDFGLRVEAEGDIEIDDTLPDTVADETDGPTALKPSELLMPAATDADGSESLNSIRLVVTGLPGDGSFTIANGVSGVPKGADVTLETAADGSTTLTISFDSSDAKDVGAAYSNIALTLPTDFSTGNRSDLAGGLDGPTSLPIELTLTATTDEDRDLSVDTPNDGQATASRIVEIAPEADVEVTAPAEITAEEDGGEEGGDGGVTVDMGIDVSVTDLDGSESESDADPRFATVVEITFDDLPDGTTVNGGTLTGNFWTGNVAEAEALELSLPGNYSGTINAAIEAITPEGKATTNQVITITGVPDIEYDIDPILDVETDGPVTITPSDNWVISTTDPDEDLTNITFTLDNLPPGVVVGGGGTITYDEVNGGSFTFSGTEEEYNNLTLTFPTDFSTESRNDFPEGPITGTIEATSTDGGPIAGPPLELTIEPEGDVAIRGDGNISLVETDGPDDAPLDVRLADYLAPVATDADGSETVNNVVVAISGLPDGTRVSLDGGNTFVNVNGGTFDFDGSLADYDNIVVRLPKDFSTENPGSSIEGRVTATTDEGGTARRNFDIEVAAEPDVTVEAPASQTFDEDGGKENADGGVLVDFGIDAAGNDLDGSEDDIDVRIVFTDFPNGVRPNDFSGGSFNANTGVWTGTAAEANALTLQLPDDYSGDFSLEITATSPEGSATTTQDITVNPVHDVEVVGGLIRTEETDAAVTVKPSDTWSVTENDTDPNQPTEDLQEVRLELSDLPADMIFNGVPAATITYDPTTGGDFVFVGTVDEFEALELVFPKDFSTESRLDATPGNLTGTLSATSTETVTPVEQAVSIRVDAEGDVEITENGNISLTETDDELTFKPSDSLSPAATDVDGSETIDSLTLEITGLPGDGSFTIDNGVNFAAAGIPRGALSLSTAGNGSATLTVTLTDADVADVVAAFEALEITLPADFSTANRSDLNGSDPDGPTSRPIRMELTVSTDEDQALGNDTPIDGQATATARVTVAFSEDITLDVPETITAEEDDGAQPPDSQDGVRVELPIDITITDDDGSETASESDTRFDADVTIVFDDLPNGTTVSHGTLNGNTWTGSVRDATAAGGPLELILPPNYNGTIQAEITVETPEGSETTDTTIVITPTPDVAYDIDPIVDVETDGPVTITPSDSWKVSAPAPGEDLTNVTLTLDNLPPGVVITGGGTITYDEVNGGSFTFSGTEEEYNNLTLTFPTDFSTESRNDFPEGPIIGTIEATSTEGGPIAGPPLELTIEPEGDVEITGTGVVDLAETDDVVDFKPSDALSPAPTDIDGSESITEIVLDFVSLPSGTLFSTDGVTFSAVPGNGKFTLTADEYADLVIRLPEDFSTGLPSNALEATLTATTDEGGVATADLEVNVVPEGDIELVGPGTIELDENDPSNVDDVDNTTKARPTFKPSDALDAQATDADNSESVESIDVEITGLPDGTQVSTNNGNSYTAITGNTYTATDLTPGQYGRLVFRLPNDYSTTSPGDNDAGPIEGTVTFSTDEALQVGETDTGPDDGIETGTFTVVVNDEADIEIIVDDITIIEDLGQPVPLNLDTYVVDIDNSESIVEPVTVTFSDLPAGGAVFNDGTADITLTPGDNVWSGTVAQLQALTLVSLPEHFSGIIGASVNVITDEGVATGGTRSFDINVTPVAEPTIELSVDETEDQTTEYADDQYSVKEDTSFLLKIDADTPDKDGSEELTKIVIENVPEDWLPNGDISGLFEIGAGDIASATKSGSTVTITLNGGVTTFEGGLRVTPTTNSDEDVETIVGADMVATVTAVDSAAGLPSDTATASDGTDVDLDAVVDPINLQTRDTARTETVTSNTNQIQLDTRNIDLTDLDGSEVIDRVELTFTIGTESDPFDPANDLSLIVRGSFANRVEIVQTGSTGDTVTYVITPTDGTSMNNFSTAVEDLRIVYPKWFSGVIETAGEVFWNETTTGDVELVTDPLENFASETFSSTATVRPRAEATLNASVFTLTTEETYNRRTSLEQEVVSTQGSEDNEILAARKLRLLESTDDGTGPGQVGLFVGMSGTTPDRDGSEQLDAIEIQNVPTDWIDYDLATGDIDLAQLYLVDGTGPLSAAELAKIDSATYDPSTGIVRIEFVDDVLDFDAALRLEPTLYEDYDIDPTGDYADPATDPALTAAGQYFNEDLKVRLETIDSNSSTTDSESATAQFNVDVEPVNNTTFLVEVGPGDEGTIDAAGGIWETYIRVELTDQDGSEEIISVVLPDVPDGITVWVRETPGDANSNFVPALLTEVDNPTGFNTWSIEGGAWDDIQFRGIPTHFAGPFTDAVQIVSEEQDGGFRLTDTTANFYVDPILDAGDPSETVGTDEDTLQNIVFDGNLIDLTTESPESLVSLTITEIPTDSYGRELQFFLQGSSTPLTPDANGEIVLTAAEAMILQVLPGQDSNETITFAVKAEYVEDIDSTQTAEITGTGTVNVRGIADDPDVTYQNPDIAAYDGSIRPNQIDDEFGGAANADQAYAYAGSGGTSFLLNQRGSDVMLRTGVIFGPDHPNYDRNFDDTNPDGTPVDPLSAISGEIDVGGPGAGGDDASELIYYLIEGFGGTGHALLGAAPTDLDPATGEANAYIVTQDQIDLIEFVAATVDEPEFVELTLHTIVVENDESLPSVSGLPIDEALAIIHAEPGAYVESNDFSVLVLTPNQENGGGTCPPETVGLPDLALIGSGDEDERIEVQFSLSADGTWNTIEDLYNLPSGISGNFSVSLSLPAGASLTSAVDGAVVLDPTTNQVVINFELLGADPTDPTLSNVLYYTPPLHESSPDGFTDGTQFGAPDVYDSLDPIGFDMTLQNFSCGEVVEGSGTYPIEVTPVPDGPQIVFTDSGSFDEDTTYSIGFDINGVDLGERPLDEIKIAVDRNETDTILLLNGDEITTGFVDRGDGFREYTLSTADIGNLTLQAGEHFSGTISYEVTATSEDVNFTTASTTETRTVEVIPVADEPIFEYDDSLIDPDTNAPYLDLSGATPVITGVEDQTFLLSDVLTGYTPDQDGSEYETFVLSADAGTLDYLEVSIAPGGPSSGLVNNRDGSYTISTAAYPFIQLALIQDHARTPDLVDDDLIIIPLQIPMSLAINTLEGGNSDTNEGSTDFIFQVRPDADEPEVTSFTASPANGVEDDGTVITLEAEGQSPDPHETLDFEISGLPDGAIVTVDGVPVTVVGGVATIPGLSDGADEPTFSFDGVVEFTVPPDFGGDLDLQVTAVSTDSSPIFTDTEASAPVSAPVSIEPQPDLDVTVLDDTVVLAESDAAVSFKPGDNFEILVTDVDLSEQETVSYTLSGLPDGTTTTAGSITGGTLTFSGTKEDFALLEITLPADFATQDKDGNDTPLTGTFQVTTNEGGDSGTTALTVTITPELDVDVAVTPDPTYDQSLTRQSVNLGIAAMVTDTLVTPVETLDEVVVIFDTALPATATASDGDFNAAMDTLTITRGASESSTDFEARVANASIELPSLYSEDISGSVVAETNHGLADAEAFTITAIPAPTGPLWPTPPAADATIDLTGDDPMDDATGTPDAIEYAVGTEDDDEVDWNGGQRPYTDIDGFQMLGGDDLLDLRGANSDFVMDMGDGDDEAYGGSGDDFLLGGAGDDELSGGPGNDILDGGTGDGTLSGGGGDDIFVLGPNPGDKHEIEDYGTGNDTIDLTQFGQGVTIELDDDELKVDGETVAEFSGSVPDEVQIIFENAAGEAEAATI